MRISRLPLAFALGATLCAPVTALASPFAYAKQDSDYVQIDFENCCEPVVIGPLPLTPAAGSFDGTDVTREYVVDYPNSDLYAVDTSDASTTLIGHVDLGLDGTVVTAMHWDPRGGRMLLMATGGGTSTLYALDLGDASVQPIGSTSEEIGTLAIDADGRAFGADLSTYELFSIDTDDGSATLVGELGDYLSYYSAFDFIGGPALSAIAFDNEAGSTAMYVIDEQDGHATLVAPWFGDTLAGFAVVPTPPADPIFESDFDPP